MVRARFRFVAAPLALAGFIVLAGCSGSALAPQASSVAPQSVAAFPQNIRITPDQVEAARQRGTLVPIPVIQTDTVVHKNEKISPKGGTFTAPVSGGFKAAFKYPSNDAPPGQTIMMAADTSNSFGAPMPSAGTPIWYFQAQLSGSGQVTFNSGTGKATISQKSLSSKHTYSVWGFVPQVLGNTPLFVIQAGSPNSKHSLSFSSPLNGATIPDGIYVDIELVQN